MVLMPPPAVALQPCGTLRAGFNGIKALASRVLTALEPCGTLTASLNGINTLASRVLTALQHCDTLRAALMVLMPSLDMF